VPDSIRSLARFLVVLAVAALAAMPAIVPAQFFPIYDQDERLGAPGDNETHVAWPFYSRRETSDTLTLGLHPIYSIFRKDETGERGVDVLYPFFNYRYWPRTRGSTDKHRSYLLPIYYQRTEQRERGEQFDRLLVPLWFQGDHADGGKYRILFPLIWYAHQARLPVPLFPPRPVTFAAVFPIAGNIKGYWNHDNIRFFLWPLFVHSSKGTGEDFSEIYSFVWPITGIYKGPKVSGFRLWPLFAYAKREGEFERAYWLWPLGHYRKGRIADSDDRQQNILMFLPFYAKFHRDNVKLDAVIPFYAKLSVGDRTVHGYFFGLYNVEENSRTGIRERRWLWFVVRSRKALEGHEPDPDRTTGGGVFPFYTRVSNDSRVSKNIIWPLHVYRWNKRADHEYKRHYYVPVYARAAKNYDDGSMSVNQYFFPFFRRVERRTGETYSSAIHLFPYSWFEPLDRNWAPLWTFWEKETDIVEETMRVRWFKNAWKFERAADGSERKKINLLLFTQETTHDAMGAKTGSTRFLFGLVGRHRDPDLRTELFWMKF